MVAMPTAAAAPDRKDVGSDQNSGAHVNTPAAATESATTATAVLLTKEAATMKPATPISRAGTASIRNIHCQPRRPPLLPKASMIHPDSGLPKIPATGMADMNRAMIFARRLAGNQ